MMKKMRRAPKEPSPSASCAPYGDDARQIFKYQSLFQDYMELLKETEAKKKKLQKARQKKLQLLAEVRFLRRKYKSLSENPSQEVPFRLKKPSHSIPSPSICIAQSVSSLVPNEVPSKRKQYRISEATNASTSMKEYLSVNSSQYRFKKQMHKNPPSTLCVARSLGMFIPKEVPSQDKSYRVKEAANASTSPVLDLNQVSLMNGEEMEAFQLEQDLLKMEKLKRFSMNGGGPDDIKLAICRDVGKKSNRAGKRKISWQDQVALKV